MKKSKAFVWLAIGALMLLLVLAVVAPIDRSPIQGRPVYHKTQAALDTFSMTTAEAGGAFMAGWGKVAILPDGPQRLVGYGRRSIYGSVHDTLYARIAVLSKGDLAVALVSVDLLIFPPALSQAISVRNKLVDHHYFSATHTHHGFGGWQPGAASALLFGGFDEHMVQNMADEINAEIVAITDRLLPAQAAFASVATDGLVENRLDADSPADDQLRYVKLVRNDGSTAIITAFSAHATTLPSAEEALSGDYPAYLVHKLEESPRVDFAMYCAGMVGSHRAAGIETKSFERSRDYGDALADYALQTWDSVQAYPPHVLAFGSLPLQFENAQMRISDNLRVRSWLFEKLMAPLEANIQVLRLGDIVFIGMPSDFSGELALEYSIDSLAASYGLRPVITGFNGHYIGYITADHHYDRSTNDEVRFMNWVGPGMGSFFANTTIALLEKINQP